MRACIAIALASLFVVVACAAIVDLEAIEYRVSQAPDGEASSPEASSDAATGSDGGADAGRDGAPCVGQTISDALFSDGGIAKTSTFPSAAITPNDPTVGAVRFDVPNDAGGGYAFYEWVLTPAADDYCVVFDFEVTYEANPTGTIDGPTLVRTTEPKVSLPFELTPTGRFKLGDSTDAVLADPLPLGVKHDVRLELDRRPTPSGGSSPPAVDYAVHFDGVAKLGTLTGDLDKTLTLRLGISSSNGAGGLVLENVSVVVGSR